MNDATHDRDPAQHSNGRPACRSWCEDAEKDRNDPYGCRGDHRGKAWGTIASAGFPPMVDSIDPPSHETVLVRPQFAQSDYLPGASLCWGNMGRTDGDYEVELTPKVARALAGALVAAADTAESA